MRSRSPTTARNGAARLACLLASLLPAGCAWVGSGPATQPVMTAKTRRPPTDPSATARRPPESDLEAIEQFLERTKEYAVRTPPAVPTETVAPPRNPEPVSTPPLTREDEPERIAATDTANGAARANAQMALPESPPAEPKLALPVLQSISVVPEKPVETRRAAPPKAPMTNTGLEVLPPSPRPSLDDVLVQLREEVKTADDAEAYWQLRFVQLALDHREDLFETVPGLTEETNKLMQATFKATVAVRDFLANPTATGEKAVEAVDDLHQELADRADPEVASVALCRQVVTFGVYDEMGASEFLAGRAIHTIVYSEVRNLRSKLNDDGRFETRLATRLELLTRDGTSVWQKEEPEIVDTCRRRRTDFFIAQRITLPPTLPAGDYVLKVFVEDQISQRAAEATHPLTIASPLSVAKRP